MANYTIFLNAIEADLAISGAYYDLVQNGGRMVHKYGDETISGVKDFASRPTVNGVGVLLQGEGGTGSGGSYGDLVTGISGAFGTNLVYGTGIGQVVWGNNSTTSGNYAVVIGGIGNRAIGAGCLTIGGSSSFQPNLASGLRCTIINGINNKIEAGQGSIILGGQNNKLSGIDSFCFGRSNIISGDFNSSVGQSNTIIGDSNASVSPYSSYIEGDDCVAVGSYTRFSGCSSAGIISAYGDYTYSSGSYTIVIASRSGTFINSAFILTNPAPSASTDNCYKGQIAVDDSYIYVGTGVNQWGRVALSNF